MSASLVLPFQSRRPALAALAVVLPLSLALGGCGKPPESRPEEVRPVRVLKVEDASASRSAEFAAEVRARYETRLAFRVGGNVVERLVEVGSRVRPGQPIARLDPADLVLAASSARAQAEALETEKKLAAADLQRYRELREKNFISQAEYDRRVTTLESAASRHESALAAARQAANQAAYAVLVADSAGVVTGLEAEAGQVVAPGQTVARLARAGEIEAVFSVPEAQKDLVEGATALLVSLNAVAGRTWKARVRELSPAADPVTRTYQVRATILDPGKDVDLGMSARVALSFGGAGRPTVPVSALVSRGDKPQVFIVENGAVQPRDVATAGIAGERVVIASGLKPGEQVVAAGAALLRPGQRVRVLDGK